MSAMIEDRRVTWISFNKKLKLKSELLRHMQYASVATEN